MIVTKEEANELGSMSIVDVHLWPEWIEDMERLMQQRYFDLDGPVAPPMSPVSPWPCTWISQVSPRRLLLISIETSPPSRTPA